MRCILDAGNRRRGTPEPLEPKHDLRSGLDVSMVLFDQVVRYFDDRTFVSSDSTPSAFISRTARCEADSHRA
jgi:predicted hotdog family 3-hydroxylacyl-ACP dehydratase